MLVVRAVVVAVIVAGGAAGARAERDLCGRGAVFRGTPIDLDVQRADVHQVFRLLADVGRVNIVVPDEVKAKVTLKLKRVPWDQVACTVAAVHKLSISVDGNVLLVLPRS